MSNKQLKKQRKEVRKHIIDFSKYIVNQANDSDNLDDKITSIIFLDELKSAYKKGELWLK